MARRQWLSEERFAELVALCQFLPGPASSQLGIAIGTGRAGYLGGFFAWLGFTLPSAVALAAFAYGVHEFGGDGGGWLDGLKIAAVAVVAFALWGMGKTLTPDRTRITIAVVAAAALLLTGGVLVQLLVIAGGAVLGLVLLRPGDAQGDGDAGCWTGTRIGVLALVVFAVALLALPFASRVVDSQPLAVADSFYRSGSLVFGGGHVVLPLLEAEVVSTELVTKDEFLAGYGAAQAVPGPLFTFSTYLGTVMGLLDPWWLGGLLALAAIFLPSFLLVWGVLPFWERVRGFTSRATGPHGRQRRRGWHTPRGALRPCLDQCHRRPGGLWPRRRCVRAARILEDAAVARGGPRRRGRGAAGGAVIVPRYGGFAPSCGGTNRHCLR